MMWWLRSSAWPRRKGVAGEALLLLRTAAYFHDLGFVEQREQHEAIGARVAAETLPRFGYRPDQIALIQV